MRPIKCECSDPGCPACAGKCTRRATEALIRADFAGQPECAFCADCASDAMESGVFAYAEERAD